MGFQQRLGVELQTVRNKERHRCDTLLSGLYHFISDVLFTFSYSVSDNKPGF